MNKIDFVVTWVDGSDPVWQAEWQSVAGAGKSEETSEVRWRDMELMKYWFRAIENFAPFVNKIHFVTCGHTPKWLNTEHPKLNIVRHSDFIPAEYLPTFNSITIALNIHRIEGLSEQFVYFNDDMFIVRAVDDKLFFRGGMPCDMARESLLINKGWCSNVAMESMKIINRRYQKRKVQTAHFWHWYSPKYGLHNIAKTASMMVWGAFEGLYDHHCPIAFRRKTFERLWNEEFDVLDSASRHAVRSTNGVSEWLMRYEQLVSGEFAPVSPRQWRYFDIADENAEQAIEAVRSQSTPLVCLNDTPGVKNFEDVCRKLGEAFNTILPKRSSYELE